MFKGAAGPGGGGGGAGAGGGAPPSHHMQQQHQQGNPSSLFPSLSPQPPSAAAATPLLAPSSSTNTVVMPKKKKVSTGVAISFDPSAPGVYAPGGGKQNNIQQHPDMMFPSPVTLMEPSTLHRQSQQIHQQPYGYGGYPHHQLPPPPGMHRSYSNPSLSSGYPTLNHAQGGYQMHHQDPSFYMMQQYGQQQQQGWAGGPQGSWGGPMVPQNSLPSVQLFFAEFNGERFPGFYDDYGGYHYFQSEEEARVATKRARDAASGPRAPVSSQFPPPPPSVTHFPPFPQIPAAQNVPPPSPQSTFPHFQNNGQAPPPPLMSAAQHTPPQPQSAFPHFQNNGQVPPPPSAFPHFQNIGEVPPPPSYYQHQQSLHRPPPGPPPGPPPPMTGSYVAAAPPPQGPPPPMTGSYVDVPPPPQGPPPPPTIHVPPQPTIEPPSNSPIVAEAIPSNPKVTTKNLTYKELCEAIPKKEKKKKTTALHPPPSSSLPPNSSTPTSYATTLDPPNTVSAAPVSTVSKNLTYKELCKVIVPKAKKTKPSSDTTTPPGVSLSSSGRSSSSPVLSTAVSYFGKLGLSRQAQVTDVPATVDKEKPVDSLSPSSRAKFFLGATNSVDEPSNDIDTSKPLQPTLDVYTATSYPNAIPSINDTTSIDDRTFTSDAIPVTSPIAPPSPSVAPSSSSGTTASMTREAVDLDLDYAIALAIFASQVQESVSEEGGASSQVASGSAPQSAPASTGVTDMPKAASSLYTYGTPIDEVGTLRGVVSTSHAQAAPHPRQVSTMSYPYGTPIDEVGAKGSLGYRDPKISATALTGAVTEKKTGFTYGTGIDEIGVKGLLGYTTPKTPAVVSAADEGLTSETTVGGGVNPAVPVEVREENREANREDAGENAEENREENGEEVRRTMMVEYLVRKGYEFEKALEALEGAGYEVDMAVGILESWRDAEGGEGVVKEVNSSNVQKDGFGGVGEIENVAPVTEDVVQGEVVEEIVGDVVEVEEVVEETIAVEEQRAGGEEIRPVEEIGVVEEEGVIMEKGLGDMGVVVVNVKGTVGVVDEVMEKIDGEVLKKTQDVGDVDEGGVEKKTTALVIDKVVVLDTADEKVDARVEELVKEGVAIEDETAIPARVEEMEKESHVADAKIVAEAKEMVVAKPEGMSETQAIEEGMIVSEKVLETVEASTVVTETSTVEAEEEMLMPIPPPRTSSNAPSSPKISLSPLPNVDGKSPEDSIRVASPVPFIPISIDHDHKDDFTSGFESFLFDAKAPVTSLVDQVKIYRRLSQALPPRPDSIVLPSPLQRPLSPEESIERRTSKPGYRIPNRNSSLDLNVPMDSRITPSPPPLRPHSTLPTAPSRLSITPPPPSPTPQVPPPRTSTVFSTSPPLPSTPSSPPLPLPPTPVSPPLPVIPAYFGVAPPPPPPEFFETMGKGEKELPPPPPPKENPPFVPKRMQYFAAPLEGKK